MNGVIYIISAPSGTGKSTLIDKLIQKKMPLYNIKRSISYTTRKIRSKEINGKHYYFVTIDKFKKMISENNFFEHARIFDHYYGTSKKKIEYMLNLGTDIILDIDWQGAQQIKKKTQNTKSIFLLPPSFEELKNRLSQRGQDSKKSILKRIKQAKHEIKHCNEYDYVIINDNLTTATLQLQSIIVSEKLHYHNQRFHLKKLINEYTKK